MIRSLVALLLFVIQSPITPGRNTGYVKASSSSGTITRINHGSWGEQQVGFVTSQQVNETLGWTVTPGNFFVVEVAGLSGTTITGLTANVGATPYTLTLALSYSAGRSPISIYYLDNAPALTSMNVLMTSSNGSDVSIIAAEYAGLSPTAAPVSAAVTTEQSFVNTSTWSVGPYTVPSGALVLSGSTSTLHNGTDWTPGTGWTIVDQENSLYPAMVLQESINPTAGSMTGSGTYISDYQYYDNFIIAFK